MKHFLRILACLLVLVPSICAQAPNYPLSPLLFVRFQGPDGLAVTFYQGTSNGREFGTPAAVGLRPGYSYRVRLMGLPKHPDAELFPTITVFGSLQMPVGLNPANHPVPINFSEEDIEKALAGTMITKAITLEDPNLALPEATDKNQPIEIRMEPDQDPIVEAKKRGRLLLLVRLGSRLSDAEELARQSLPNTILFPKEKYLAQPPIGPQFQWVCWPIYASLMNRRPMNQEFLYDGGDVDNRVGFAGGGKLGGLEPTDTVAEYSNSKGERKITPSNRVRIIVPRYLVLSTETAPIGYNALTLVGNTQGAQGQFTHRTNTPTSLAEQQSQLEGTRGQSRVSQAITQQGTHFLEDRIGDAIVRGNYKDISVTGSSKFAQSEPHDRPLLLKKWSDRQVAQVGDIITFHLRYSNVGGKPIEQVVISDSLTGRFEYLRGTAKSDREVIFTQTVNEVGSQILRWEVVGVLQPGQFGEVTFQVKVR